MAKNPSGPQRSKSTDVKRPAWRGIQIKTNSRPTSRKSYASTSSLDLQSFDDKSSSHETIDSLSPRLDSVKEYITPLSTSSRPRSCASSVNSLQEPSDMQKSESDFETKHDDAMYYSSFFTTETVEKPRITSLTYEKLPAFDFQEFSANVPNENSWSKVAPVNNIDDDTDSLEVGIAITTHAGESVTKKESISANSKKNAAAVVPVPNKPVINDHDIDLFEEELIFPPVPISAPATTMNELPNESIHQPSLPSSPIVATTTKQAFDIPVAQSQDNTKVETPKSPIHRQRDVVTVTERTIRVCEPPKSPVHQYHEAIATISVDEPESPVHQQRETIETISVDEPKSPVHQQHETIATIPVDEPKSPVNQQSEAIATISVDEARSPVRQQREIIATIPVDEARSPQRQDTATIPAHPVTDDSIDLHRRDSISTHSTSTKDDDDDDDSRIQFSEDRQSHSRFDFLPIALEEDPADLDMIRDNEIAVHYIDVTAIQANRLGPRDQEEADEHVREGIRLFFNNKFMKSKAIFQSHAATDPLYAVALGLVAFTKAIMTQDESDIAKAMSTLASAYAIAKAQVDAASTKRSLKDSLSHYFSALMVSNNSDITALPTSAATVTVASGPTTTTTFLSNGVLRAHAIKGECSLLMGIMQLSRESIVDYIKCGLNLRRAYKSYSIVWEEYKRMGQEHTKYMDRDTVSAMQFGIGSIHLLLSSLPPKILKVFSTMGWTTDTQLGLVLLKLCLEARGTRSPLASLILLSYYSVLTSVVPQHYSQELAGPAVECLLEAQKSHPGSCFFLYFAARIARAAGNLPLSTQSFSFAMDASRGEMMEVAMRHVTLYETGWNHALQLDWESAARNFEDLAKEKYAPAFCMYVVGACREMLGQRTQGILAFAEVPQQINKTNQPYTESYICKKVALFQKSGYQDMNLSIPMLELLCIWNAFEQMEPEALEQCLEWVNSGLGHIHDRERRELEIRTQELAPMASPPDYYHHRALLLLIKASITNALHRYNDSIPHLNWIMDNKEDLTSQVAAWVIPFAYWEAGVTSWGLRNYAKSRKLWQQGLACSKYDFEFRMAIRFNLALAKCTEMGVENFKSATEKVLDMHAQKKAMSVHPA